MRTVHPRETGPGRAFSAPPRRSAAARPRRVLSPARPPTPAGPWRGATRPVAARRGVGSPLICGRPARSPRASAVAARRGVGSPLICPAIAQRQVPEKRRRAPAWPPRATSTRTCLPASQACMFSTCLAASCNVYSHSPLFSSPLGCNAAPAGRSGRPLPLTFPRRSFFPHRRPRPLQEAT